jgi:hypothetical protein
VDESAMQSKAHHAAIEMTGFITAPFPKTPTAGFE